MRTHLLVAATITALALPCAAHAQLGGMIKRGVGQKIGQKAAESVGKKGSELPESGADARLGGEFTADTLDRMMRGLKAYAAKVSTIDSVERVTRGLREKLGALRSAHEAEADAYHLKHRAVDECQDNFFRSRQNEHQAAMQSKMKSDPTFASRMAAKQMTYSRQLAEAQQKGDTTEVARLMRDGMQIIYGVDMKKDTADAVAKCGALPVSPAFLAEEDSLDARVSRLNDYRRETELAARAAAITESGLSQARYDQAFERIERWYRITAKGDRKRFWSDAEGALLEARRADIERAFRAIDGRGA